MSITTEPTERVRASDQWFSNDGPWASTDSIDQNHVQTKWLGPNPRYPESGSPVAEFDAVGPGSPAGTLRCTLG